MGKEGRRCGGEVIKGCVWVVVGGLASTGLSSEEFSPCCGVVYGRPWLSFLRILLSMQCQGSRIMPCRTNQFHPNGRESTGDSR